MICHRCGFQVYMNGSCNCTKRMQDQIFGGGGLSQMQMNSVIEGLDKIGGLLMEIINLIKLNTKSQEK